KVTKRLDANVDKTKPEAIRYLPQNYFEQLTNDIEIEAFRREIEDVVFSHVDRTDRMEKDTFVELQEFKTQQSAQEISVLKAKLRELNIEIVRLEEQADPLFKKKLEEELNAKKDELGSLDNTKPSEVLKPETETPEQKKLSEKIAQLTKQAKQLEESERNTVEIIAQKKNKLQKLSSLQQSVSAMSAQIVSQKLELKSVCEELGLNIEAIVKAEINTHSIEEQSLVLTTEIQVLEIDNKKQFSNEIDFNMLASLLDLRAACAYIKERVIELKEQLDTPQRKYQTYLDKLAKWSKQREDIIGNEVEPRSGTIKHLESQISYIDKELSKKLLTARGARKEISEKIFSSKQKILTFYSELKQSVEAKLSLVRTSGFSVNINASFVLDQSFSKLFLDFIRKNRKGYFHGANDPKQALSLLLSEVEWNDFDSIYKFIEIAIKKMEVHDGEPLSIKEQVSDIKHFYDFLFSLEYFSARYELRLGGKNLNKLSPGEKGLLLLVFYLQLDKDDIPLVIDQPEDNLDNESIFTVLAQCIRDAKKNRQVILVTHNPNLAVGADAEQIIYVQLDKVENYKFTYESGAIENPRINQKIVDVLEGTQPAFIKRRLKYQI
ncbi:TrlF family AAA-like ATPase, partial [Nitrosomonas sp.]|uniref:TrlF family AAA-like ATPase n=1 Tax=Nitrosomonas sp. TaxID=42353 RepID=UPI00345C97D6